MLVVEEVLEEDVAAYVYSCMKMELGNRAYCTKLVNEINREVARDWCIENQ